MDVLYPIHKEWSEKILSGEKPFEFRTKLPTGLKVGSIVYIYETAKGGGCKKVVGEFKVKKVRNLLSEDGKYPLYGCYHFIDFYFTFINPNKEYADAFFQAKKDFGTKSSPYHIDTLKYGFEINYALSPDDIASLKENNVTCKSSLADGPYQPDAICPNLLTRLVENRNKNQNAMEECDNWLRKIGFYSETDESYWKYAIEISDVEKYGEPIKLSDFISVNTKSPITFAPQSFIYVERKTT